MISIADFNALTESLVNGLLRDAIGYRIEYTVPYYKGIVGYMVEAPMLSIRSTRFPILFLAYDGPYPELLNDLVTQLGIGKATEYFAVVVVIPARLPTGKEAEELRQLLTDSVFRYDFVVLDNRHLASIIAQNSSRRVFEIALEQGISLARLSPYVTVGPAPPNMFFGRDTELKAITNTVSQGDCAIVGARRIGKTSILQTLQRMLASDPRYEPLYVNLEAAFKPEECLAILADELQTDARAGGPATVVKLIADLSKRNNDNATVLIFDEVDELLATDSRLGSQLFRGFRAASHQGYCHFVFSGSRTLHRQLHNSASPLFNFAKTIPVGPLSEVSVAEIVKKPMTQLGVELVEEEVLIRRLVEVTSCHPSLVQWICHGLLDGRDSRRITVADLEEVSATDQFYAYFVETALGTASPAERLLALSVEQAYFEMGDAIEIMRRFGIEDRARVAGALEMLLMTSVLRRQGSGYTFTLRQFPRVVRETGNLESLIDANIVMLDG